LVLEPHDVVFAKIATRLYLDDLERHLAGVFQAVDGAQRNVSRLVLGNEDYLIAIDILRNRVEKVLTSVDRLQRIPGATTLRVGENRISLAEIRSLLEDANQFRLEPLSGMIRAAGISRDPALTVNYLQSQFFQNNLASETASQRVRTYEDSMRVYMQEKSSSMSGGTGGASSLTTGGQRTSSSDLSVPAMIPQFGESFLDRIITIANRNQDTTFRQKLIEDMNTAGLERWSLSEKQSTMTLP
jgi:hypothetical protein